MPTLTKRRRSVRVSNPALTLCVLAEMTRGERVVVQARPEYGYAHPDCGLAPPPGAAADAAFAFDLQLLNWCAHAGWAAE